MLIPVDAYDITAIVKQQGLAQTARRKVAGQASDAATSVVRPTGNRRINEYGIPVAG